MSKLAFTLYGKEYNVNCDDGEEARLRQVINFVEKRMQEVAGRAGNTTEARILMLTCLSLADEALEAQGRMKAPPTPLVTEDQTLVLAAINHLKDRIANIASQVGTA